MKKTTLTRDEMIARLDALTPGTKIRWAQYPVRVFEVLHVEQCGGELHRIDVTLLEVGKPESTLVPGICLLKGQMVEHDNRRFTTWYARKSDMANFEIVAEEAVCTASLEGVANFFAAVVAIAEQMVIDQAATVAVVKPAKAARELRYEQVLERKADFGDDGSLVVYTVLSSDASQTYQTTLVNGVAKSCTCPSRQRCYHMSGCEARESFEQWWEQPLSEAEQAEEASLIAEAVLGEDAQAHADELTPEEYDDLTDLIDETPEEHAAYRAKLVAEQKPRLILPAEPKRCDKWAAPLNGQERKVEYPFGRAVFMR